MPNILIRFTSEQSRWLKERSKRSGDAVSEIVRQRVAVAMPPPESSDYPAVPLDKTLPVYEGNLGGKWIYDGCTTIPEMIERLRQAIAHLEDLRQSNLRLQGEVQDDLAVFVTQDPRMGKKHKFQRIDASEYF
jgi:hypothetical protein